MNQVPPWPHPSWAEIPGRAQLRLGGVGPRAALLVTRIGRGRGPLPWCLKVLPELRPLTCGLGLSQDPAQGGAWPGPGWGAGLLQEGGGPGQDPEGKGRGRALTRGLEVLAELRLGLPIGPEAALLRELVGHGGGGDDGFEAALALGHVLLRVEEDDVDLGHVEHPQRHRGAQTHRDRQRRRLDVQLEVGRGGVREGSAPASRSRPQRQTQGGQTPTALCPCPALCPTVFGQTGVVVLSWDFRPDSLDSNPDSTTSSCATSDKSYPVPRCPHVSHGHDIVLTS